ncbi:MAG: zinc finger family protein [Trebouxia sp. A1-2]|nr:MAG: zinc finger family protein [Trebouxia sp. A1-2]
MDPRRVSELSEAAAWGAARRAAADVRQRSIQEAMTRAREHPYTPDMEMLDAPPLDSSRRSGNIFMSLMRSGSLPDSESLDRQVSADSAATLDSASNSEPYLSSHPNGLRISTRAAIPQRQHSGKMASSVADPPSRHLQHRSSLNQPSSPQVINLDDDSPLPLRQRGQAISAANNRLQVNASDRQDGGCLVDLTGFPSSSADPSAASRMHAVYSHEAGDFLDLSRWHSGPFGSERRDPEGSNRNGDVQTSQHPAQQLASTSDSRLDAANQEDLDLALGKLHAMALAAEDDEAAPQFMPPLRHSTRFSSNRARHPGTLAGSFIPGFAHPHLAHVSSDPMSAITHSLLGGGRFDLESSQALLASLMADFEVTRAVHSSSHAMGSGPEDMSYEALTSLEDVKLTAPPELLATMPLDMCLKGGAWDNKACSICQSEYEPDEVIMILPCEHHFHKDCAMEWLGKHSKKCPICKESVGG